MAQGKLKCKVQKPGGTKQKNQRHKKPLGPKKGPRQINPKKAKHVEAQKMQKDLTKALNSHIEHLVTTQATRSEHTNLRVLKPAAKSD